MLAAFNRRLRVLLRELVLVLVHGVVRIFNQDERRIFLGRLLGNSHRVDQSSAYDAFDDFVASHGMTDAQRERFLQRCFEGVSPSRIPQSVIDIFGSASGGNIYHSQEGEDILLERLFANKINGFFVDVGAHHATRFSNTFALYKKGWRGVNIDAAPGSMDSFMKFRPRDINLEVAISDKVGPLLLNVFKEGALNTFDSTLADSYTAGGWERTDAIELQTRSLSDVLDQHLTAGQKIDLLSVDVEGEDLGVLRSNNWDKYCPEVIIIEALDTPLHSLHTHPAITFLSEQGFSPIARLFNSVILRREGQPCAGS